MSKQSRRARRAQRKATFEPLHVAHVAANPLDPITVDPKVAAAVKGAIVQLMSEFPQTVLAVNIQILHVPPDGQVRGYFQTATDPCWSGKGDLLQMLFAECTRHQQTTQLVKESIFQRMPQPPGSSEIN